MDVYSQIAWKIIRSQQDIIGPIAIEQAGNVDGILVEEDKGTVSFKGNPISVINELVEEYAVLFGKASVEVSKEAAASLISGLPDNAIPELLR